MTLTFRNQGTPAYNVFLTDTLPSRLRLQRDNTHQSNAVYHPQCGCGPANVGVDGQQLPSSRLVHGRISCQEPESGRYLCSSVRKKTTSPWCMTMTVPCIKYRPLYGHCQRQCQRPFARVYGQQNPGGPRF